MRLTLALRLIVLLSQVLTSLGQDPDADSLSESNLQPPNLNNEFVEDLDYESASHLSDAESEMDSASATSTQSDAVERRKAKALEEVEAETRGRSKSMTNRDRPSFTDGPQNYRQTLAEGELIESEMNAYLDALRLGFKVEAANTILAPEILIEMQTGLKAMDEAFDELVIKMGDTFDRTTVLEETIAKLGKEVGSEAKTEWLVKMNQQLAGLNVEGNFMEEEYERMNFEILERRLEITVGGGEVPKRIGGLSGPKNLMELHNRKAELVTYQKLERDIAKSSNQMKLSENVLKNTRAKVLILVVAVGVMLSFAAFIRYWVLKGYEHQRKEALPHVISPLGIEIEHGYHANPKSVMIDYCKAMHQDVLRVEGIAEELLTTPVWLAALNTLGPTFHQAYEIASQSEIDRLSKKVPRNWGAPAASPATPIIPAAMLEKEKTIILDEHQHAVNNWTVFEFLRPIHLQHQLTQQHRRNVHQAAYIIMKDATTLRGAQFDKAYTATFARMAFLPECLPYAHEDLATIARLRKPRQEQSLQALKTRVALAVHFAARSTLPPTAPLSALP